MMTDVSTVRTWIEKRVTDILEAPRMWGTRDAVEALVVTLAEAHLVTQEGDVPENKTITADYAFWCQTRGHKTYLSQVGETELNELKFVLELREFFNFIITQ